MAETNTAQLNERFALPNTSLSSDVMGELQSILRLHSISPQELFYKWESYSIKMGSDQATISLKSARDFKKDLQDVLEREVREKTHSTTKKAPGATPRSVNSKVGGSGDLFGMMEGVSPDTPRLPMRGVNGNSSKRKSNFETPTSKTSKFHATSSPGDQHSIISGQTVAFAQRQNAGQIVESLNPQIEIPTPPTKPSSEPRIKLKANTDLSKFSYKPMAMKLSGASEILDDRIDGFLDLVQQHHSLEDGAFGNPANQSANEIVTVGRIASDTNEGKLNAASLVLETSRRTGAGLRVPLKLDGVSGYEFFPGKIVALRGSNASGDYFSVSEILDIPLLPPAASTVGEVDIIRAKLRGDSDEDSIRPLNILISSGPYTADLNLDFEPLQAFCERALTTHADALILLGPFLDVEHPMIKSGNIPDLPTSLNINPDTATFTDVFRGLISLPLQRLTQALPNLQIILVPSVRDAVHKHISWPQDKINRKELGLPKQVASVTNPVTISLNEIVVGISSEDVLQELHYEKCAGGHSLQENLLARLSKQVIEQRHFFPIFPSTARENLPKPTATEGNNDKAAGASLDLSYLALGEWQHVRPDVLITPSTLAPFAKVVESVLVINPGTLSKKKGPGTFSQLTVQALEVGDEEREAGSMLAHRIFDRTRVDVVRI